MPLLFGLHGANNSNATMQGLTKGSRLETNFVRAFPKSNTTAWVYSAADNDRITAIYNDLLANYCIDKNRIFITGHSSGAQMITRMLCGGEKRFKAVAPVAAGKSCEKFSPVPVMYIQGIMDAQRGNGNGADVVAMFTLSNMCSTETKPNAEVPTCNSTFDKKPVTPGCVTYQKCAAPTIWCSHNDNGYNLTDGHMHGWPCFANNAMSDFFLGLP
jgi:polyhydroxybutyrate depolymerase